MSTCLTKLVRREDIAQGTTAFFLEKPSGFAFKPGQAVELVIEEAVGQNSGSLRHAFSLVSAPFETELVLATRMRGSAYKNALKALPMGAAVQLVGPFGSFALHSDEAQPAVCIAGGIGITPFISMLRQLAHEQSTRQITLFYSNRRPEEAAFLAELQRLAEENPSFEMVATMTQVRQSEPPWPGETGYIDKAMLKKTIKDVAAPIYYLVGPPSLIESMRDMLDSAGVSEENVRSEAFYGY